MLLKKQRFKRRSIKIKHKMTDKQAIDEFAESLTDKILKAGKQDGRPLQVLKNSW